MIATMIEANWGEKRLQLKKEIITFFHKRGATKEQIIQAAEFIKTTGERAAEMAFYDQQDYADEEYIEPLVKESFSVDFQKPVIEFSIQVSLLHFDLLQYLEEQRTWKEESWGRDDFEHEDWESTQPKLELIVTPDKLILKSLEFVEGLEERLPKGWTYLGNGQRQFPLSCRGELEELTRPAIVKYPGVGEIILEKFDPQKFTTEKVGFWIGETVFNLSEGWGDEDALSPSRLWRGQRTVDEFKAVIWQEISKYLPRYKQGILIQTETGHWINYKGFYFHLLLRLALLVNEGKKVKLLYRSDLQHATMIKRCIYWLASQIKLNTKKND